VQVEAISGRSLQDEAFFRQTLETLQRIIIDGIRLRL